MEFYELNEQEFLNFTVSYDKSNFLQTINMANYYKLSNRKVYYVGIKNKGEVIAAGLIYGIKSKLGYHYFIARGYLVDYTNLEVLSLLNKGTVKLLKKNKGISLTLEPDILTCKRDSNGLILEDSIINFDIYKNIIKLGYTSSDFKLESDETKQIRWGFSLNLKGKTKDEIFSEFNSTTRNLIRKSIKYGVEVVEVNYNDLERFKGICDSSANRKSFNSKSLAYFQAMYKSFVNDSKIKFMIAQLDVDFYRNYLDEERSVILTKQDNIRDQKSNKYIEYQEAINNIDKRIDFIKPYIGEGNQKLDLACAMFMIDKNETTYLFSGSNDKFLYFNGQYLLQWYIIQYAIENSIQRHNFYGITGDLHKDNPKYGVYDFKKGFNGNVDEYLGDFKYIISNTRNNIIKVFKIFKR